MNAKSIHIHVYPLRNGWTLNAIVCCLHRHEMEKRRRKVHKCIFPMRNKYTNRVNREACAPSKRCIKKARKLAQKKRVIKGVAYRLIGIGCATYSVFRLSTLSRLSAIKAETNKTYEARVSFCYFFFFVSQSHILAIAKREWKSGLNDAKQIVSLLIEQWNKFSFFLLFDTKEIQLRYHFSRISLLKALKSLFFCFFQAFFYLIFFSFYFNIFQCRCYCLWWLHIRIFSAWFMYCTTKDSPKLH